MSQTSAFIAALTEAVVPSDQLDLTESERREVLAETSAFVEGQVRALPRRLALMFSAGTLVFRLYVRLTHFRSFCALNPQARRRVVEQWAYGKVPLFRALFKLVRSTALLVFFEAPAVVACLDRSRESSAGGTP